MLLKIVIGLLFCIFYYLHLVVGYDATITAFGFWGSAGIAYLFNRVFNQ